MKSIGILTFHKYYNYGTALQAYALQHYLEKNSNNNSELIDYLQKNEYVGKKLLLTRLKRIPEYICNFNKYYVLYRNKQNQLIKNREFDTFFHSKMVTSENKANNIAQLTDLCSRYDAVMIGSDQTWNPFVATNGTFLLDSFHGCKPIKLSYAPSIGVSSIPDEYKERYVKALSEFKALSCRERSGANMLSQLLSRNVRFVIDPTLLLTPTDWEEVCIPVNINRPYMLTYFLGDNKSHRRIAEKIAKEKNLQIVTLPVSYLEIANKKYDKQYVGPGGFISLVKNAEFICTDSFHGTVFSINFGKNFVSFPKRDDADINSDNNRLYDFLQVLGLESRIYTGSSIDFGDIDYTEINRTLSLLREQSKEYLEESCGLIN